MEYEIQDDLPYWWASLEWQNLNEKQKRQVIYTKNSKTRKFGAEE